MKSLRESSGFTVDHVNEVADNLQDALEDNREISDALNAGTKSQDAQKARGVYIYPNVFYLPYTASQEIGYGDIDEDLEAELAALLEPEQSKLFTCCYNTAS